MIESKFIDSKEAEKILFDPEIFNRISDDYTPENIEWPDEGFYYIGGYVDGKLASVFITHMTEKGNQIHCNILKEFRKHKDSLSRQALNIIFNLFDRVYCEIPSIYPEVLEHAKNFGFEETGVNQNEYKKDGKYHDVHVLERGIE